jgi:hypothetical protein
LDSEHWLGSAVKADQRYTLTAQALHWITAALMFIVLPIAWVMMNMPETAHMRGLLFTLHKSVGLSIVMLVAIRLTWRVMHPASSPFPFSPNHPLLPIWRRGSTSPLDNGSSTRSFSCIWQQRFGMSPFDVMAY